MISPEIEQNNIMCSVEHNRYLVLEKNDCENCCGEQQERPSDIIMSRQSHVIFDIAIFSLVYKTRCILSLCKCKDKDIIKSVSEWG